MSSAPQENDKKLLVGKINGFFGLQGWVKVFSYTKPRSNILNYSPWSIKIDGISKQLTLRMGVNSLKQLSPILKDVDSREDSQKFIGHDIYIDKEQLPELPRWRILLA